MSIFSTNSIHNMTNLGSKPVTSASVHESMNTGAAAIIYESELNFSNMIKAIGVEEVNYYAENGQGVIYEGTKLSNFFNKMIEFFNTLKKKIKELFNKFIIQIDSWIRSDEAFVKKHRNTLMQVNTKGFKYKGYKFTTDATTTKSALTTTTQYLAKNEMTHSNVGPHSGEKTKTQDKWTKDWGGNRADHIGKMRAECVGQQGNLTNKEFDKELFKLFRDNKEEAEEITNVNVSQLLSTISNFKAQKDTAKKSMTEIEKNINTIIENLRKEEKEIAKFDNKETPEQYQARAAAMRYITELSSAQKDRLAVIQKLHGSLMSALKHENRQAKSICVRLVGYSPKNESASLNTGGLNSVKFI